MAEQSIAKSFKGILRIANVKEATDHNDDKFFLKDYYGSPTGGTADETMGYDSVFYALNGNLDRYIYPGDAYHNQIAPVTDSLGNYLNINLGENSVVFGSDELNNGNNNDTVTFTQVLNETEFTQPKVFPVLTADRLIVGLEKRVNPEDKTQTPGGEIHVDSSLNFPSIVPEIIVNNNYSHSPSAIDDKTYKKLNEVDPDKTYRTIYRTTNDTVQDYDAVIHFQDDIDEHNMKENNTIDSFTDIFNLKSYVKEKLQLYLGYNTVEVPTGTIMWQYIDLAKWYDIETSRSGNWPPMGVVQDTEIFTPTLYQGVVRKGVNRIVALSNEQGDNTYFNEGDTYGPRQLKEIIPLYKRDYTICDGSTYTIHLLLPEMAGMYDYASFDQFIDLFFALGYQYTDFDVIRDHYANTKTTVNGETVYRWKSGERKISVACKDKDVLFGIDLLSMLAVKAIYNELKTGTSNNGKSACLEEGSSFYSRKNAENWIKTAMLPHEYIFNSPVPSADGGIAYTYKQPNYQKEGEAPEYVFDLGSEVNSFGSTVRYYDHDTDQYVNCKAWQTAEVQAALDLFDLLNIRREKELKEYYVFPFQIPNMVQTKEDKYRTGVFIGSSPFNWTVDFGNEPTFESVCTASVNSYPHRHAIFMGPVNFQATPYYTENSGALSATAMARSEGLEHWMPYQPYKSSTWNVNSYAIADVGNMRYDDEIHDGILTKIIQHGEDTNKDHEDPRWRNAEPNRGLTSTPIAMNVVNEKYSQSSSQSSEGQINFFCPEFVQMVPLIKL